MSSVQIVSTAISGDSLSVSKRFTFFFQPSFSFYLMPSLSVSFKIISEFLLRYRLFFEYRSSLFALDCIISSYWFLLLEGTGRVSLFLDLCLVECGKTKGSVCLLVYAVYMEVHKT